MDKNTAQALSDIMDTLQKIVSAIETQAEFNKAIVAKLEALENIGIHDELITCTVMKRSYLHC